LAKHLKAGDQAITAQRSEGRAPGTSHGRCFLSKGMAWQFRPARAAFINQSGSLDLIHVLDPYLRRWPIGALSGAWNPAEPRFKRVLSANGCADHHFECVPVWRFGNSRARPEPGTDRSPIARSDSATIYFLGALSRRRCRKRTPGPPPFSSMNSTPAASKARRTAKSLAVVMDVS
jgi:hypothetical protein